MPPCTPRHRPASKCFLQGLTGSGLSAFLYWWGSTTPSENGDNEGLILINGSTVTASGRLWAFANYSRYVHPGAVRIAASSSTSATGLPAPPACTATRAGDPPRERPWKSARLQHRGTGSLGCGHRGFARLPGCASCVAGGVFFGTPSSGGAGV